MGQVAREGGGARGWRAREVCIGHLTSVLREQVPASFIVIHQPGSDACVPCGDGRHDGVPRATRQRERPAGAGTGPWLRGRVFRATGRWNARSRSSRRRGEDLVAERDLHVSVEGTVVYLLVATLGYPRRIRRVVPRRAAGQ